MKSFQESFDSHLKAASSLGAPDRQMILLRCLNSILGLLILEDPSSITPHLEKFVPQLETFTSILISSGSSDLTSSSENSSYSEDTVSMQSLSPRSLSPIESEYAPTCKKRVNFSNKENSKSPMV